MHKTYACFALFSMILLGAAAPANADWLSGKYWGYVGPHYPYGGGCAQASYGGEIVEGGETTGACDTCNDGCGCGGGLLGRIHGCSLLPGGCGCQDPCGGGCGHGCGLGCGRGASIGASYNCGCNGSYKFPVPPLYTYHWVGMYSQQLMTDYHSPWRFPPISPYTPDPTTSTGPAPTSANQTPNADTPGATSPAFVRSASFSRAVLPVAPVKPVEPMSEKLRKLYE